MIAALEKLEFSKLDSRLIHLSHDEITQLINRYFDGETVSKLIKDYKIKIPTSQLYSIFPPVKSEEKCEHCEGTIVYPWGSKSWSERLNVNQKYCINCNHKLSSNCNCEKCRENRAIEEAEKLRIKVEEEKRKRAIIEETFVSKMENIHLEDELTLEDRFYLAVILRATLSEDMKFIQPNLKNIQRVSPSVDFTIEILKTLIARDVLIVDGFTSDLGAFEIENEKISYNIFNVNYDLNILANDFEEDFNKAGLIKRLMYPDATLFTKEFCYEMWKRIALEESKQYLLYQMNKVGYSFSPGEKTNKVFEFLVENFSVSQIYNIIYRAIANSTARYQAGEINKIHAQNSVITSCEKQGERAVAEGWNLKGYGRIKDLPESIISEVLFTSIMKISYLGFSEKPTPNF